MQLKHQRKADIDAVRGGFELLTNSIVFPTNSQMADIGNTSRVTRLSCLASGYSRGSLRLPKKDCQSFNKSLNRTVPAATYKNLIPVDSSLASPAMSFKRKRAEE